MKREMGSVFVGGQGYVVELRNWHQGLVLFVLCGVANTLSFESRVRIPKHLLSSMAGQT